ncbi:MAG: hypothetical protein ABW278_02810 [Steroidobacteraceae bacterium]
MTIGLPLSTFTVLHVLISVAAIGAGLVAVTYLASGRITGGWTGFFLATTIMTSITGFMFPPKPFGAPHAIGVISLFVLAVALVAIYVKHLQGRWGPTYAFMAILALYLNVFVLIAQSFQKIGTLRALAPAGTGPTLAIVHALVLLAFVALGFRVMRRTPSLSDLSSSAS